MIKTGENTVMNRKRIYRGILVLIAVVINIVICVHQSAVSPAGVKLIFFFEKIGDEEFQLYYSESGNFREEDSSRKQGNGENSVAFELLNTMHDVRLDFSEGKDYLITGIQLSYRNVEERLDLNSLKIGVTDAEVTVSQEGIRVKRTGEDPHIRFQVESEAVDRAVAEEIYRNTLLKKLVACVALDVIVLAVLKAWDKIIILPQELYANRRLILRLAKNDFKTRYAGSYLGIIWAFIQPIVTVLVYWFVFQIGLRSGDVGDFPFVLWLIAGLVPWFFFSEALNSGTNALIEYNYLVKKVVFKISILPVIKLISALFVHLFFIVFTLFLYSAYGYFPDIYSLQVIYYTFAIAIFVLALCYTTCSLVIFFRDLTQIISIILQVGVWMTPIMWRLEDVNMPQALEVIFKLNPMYYIVRGYREALINKVWFWENFFSTVYFWTLTLILFGIGAVIFKKLKVHFADIL